MTERKHTENGIEKALEELIKTMYYEGDLQRSATVGNALDLINRLYQKLEMAGYSLESMLFEVKNAHELRDEAITNAIQDFAERLKECAYQSSDWSHGEHPSVVEKDDIDRLVEEMLGEQE